MIRQDHSGFPTDRQPQALTMLSCADGMTIRRDVFESRFTHKKPLMNKGADIEICGKNAIIIKGVIPERKMVTANRICAVVYSGSGRFDGQKAHDDGNRAFISTGYGKFPQRIAGAGWL